MCQIHGKRIVVKKDYLVYHLLVLWIVHLQMVKTKGLDILLEELKECAVKTNKEWAKKLGVNRAITCVKPSGTVSQLVDAAHLVFMQDIIHIILELFVVIKKIH